MSPVCSQPSASMRLGGRRRVVQVAEHHVRPAEQDLAGLAGRRRPSAGPGHPDLEAGRGPSRGAGHGLRVVTRAAHRRHHRLGQPVGGQHGPQAQLAGASARPARPAPWPPRSPPAAGWTGRGRPARDGRGARCRSSGAPGQHGDPLGLDQPHRLAASNTGCGTIAAPVTRQARMPGLLAEAVEERVHHQVAVASAQPAALGPGPGHAERLRWVLIAPLLRPVVPEVNRMSLTCPGRTAAARSCATEPGASAARPSRAAQSMTA